MQPLDGAKKPNPIGKQGTAQCGGKIGGSVRKSLVTTEGRRQGVRFIQHRTAHALATGLELLLDDPGVGATQVGGIPTGLNGNLFEGFSNN